MALRMLNAAYQTVIMAPLRNGATLMVLTDGRATVGPVGRAAYPVSRQEAIRMILEDYPTTAEPGCCPLRASCKGQIGF